MKLYSTQSEIYPYISLCFRGEPTSIVQVPHGFSTFHTKRGQLHISSCFGDKTIIFFQKTHVKRITMEVSSLWKQKEMRGGLHFAWTIFYWSVLLTYSLIPVLLPSPTTMQMLGLVIYVIVMYTRGQKCFLIWRHWLRIRIHSKHMQLSNYSIFDDC